MNKLESNKKKKKDALFNTAFELFTTKGIQKTTISDIVQKAGVAKGTFYLYFTDKYDVRNKLVSYKAGELFRNAHTALLQSDSTELDEKLIFIIDHIINALNKNKSLLNFISKNLGWGIYRNALDTKVPEMEYNFYDMYLVMLEEDKKKYHDPEVMLFTIVELVSSTSYSCILHNDPLPIEEYKPFLYRNIQMILNNHLEKI